MTVSTIPTGSLSAPLGQGAYRQPFLHDTWAALSHVIGSGVGQILVAPGVHQWMRPEDRRRLLAYQVLQAYADNVRRHWLPAYMWQPGPLDEANPTAAFPQALQYREYGTARAVIDSVRSLVLGDEQRFRVPAAEPTKGPDGNLIRPDAAGLPVRAQDYLNGWFAAEKVKAKLVENETRTATLGDGVMVLTWDADVDRPRLRCYDPGFYHPNWASIYAQSYVSAGWKDEDYPPVVHIAWEWDDDDGVCWIRRATWWMSRLKQPRPRPYGGRPAVWTCMYETADFDPGRIGDADVHGFPKGAARNKTGPVDLNIDFIPVVHVPNDWPGSDLWGRSILMHVSQILDDIAAGDTDLALNSEVVASPKIITKNAGKTPQAGPGDWLNFFGDGDASILDTSKTLDALMKHAERLRQLLAQHSRLGQVLLGMVTPRDVPSGYSMRLGFASAESLEREMTQVRFDKYSLLGRMVVRFAQANGVVPTGDTPEVQIVLGKGLPADRAATMTEVQQLLGSNAISTLTAVQMLQEAGVPIDDAVAEVARIQAERYEVAIGLVEATGDVQAARDYLGLKGPGPQPPAPAPGQPGQPPAAGGVVVPEATQASLGSDLPPPPHPTKFVGGQNVPGVQSARATRNIESQAGGVG